jgi:hypothetical protein
MVSPSQLAAPRPQNNRESTHEDEGNELHLTFGSHHTMIGIDRQRVSVSHGGPFDTAIPPSVRRKAQFSENTQASPWPPIPRPRRLLSWIPHATMNHQKQVRIVSIEMHSGGVTAHPPVGKEPTGTVTLEAGTRRMKTAA